MAKPILIARVNSSWVRDEESLSKLKESLLKATNNEYHLLIVYSSKYADVDFECLNVLDATTLNVEDLQQIIKNELSR